MKDQSPWGVAILLALGLAACGGGGGGDTGSSNPPAVNTAPTASFTTQPSEGLAPLLVTFDASASRDPDGTISSYAWNFGDNSPAGSGASASHTFSTPGDYTVRLTVTDDKGATGNASVVVTVRTITLVSRYSVTFIPSDDLSVDRLPHPVSINNSGQVVGDFYSQRDNASRAFLYSHGRTVDLGTLGGMSSEAVGINESGQVAGSAQAANGDWSAFLYSDGVMKNLGSIGGAYTRYINDAGHVVGGLTTSDGSIRAFLHANGVMQILGTLGGNFSIAFGINSQSHIVGRAWVPSEDGHAFFYRNGVMEDITPVSDSSSATSINDQDQVVGWTEVRYPSGWYTTGFFYSKGVMTSIQMPSYLDDVYPLEINSSGQAVGRVDKYNDYSFGFILDQVNGMRNLTDLIDPTLKCLITEAQGINEVGQIVGEAYCPDGGYEWADRAVGVLLRPER